MLIYNVTVSIDEDVHEEWVHWMKTRHIPDVMATGYFLEHRFLRVVGEEEGGKTYAIQYTCKDLATLKRYQNERAPELQKEHNKKYEGKAVAFRTLLRVIDKGDGSA